jgi:hypothetical protein
MPESSMTLRGRIITAATLLIFIAAAGQSATAQTKTVDAGADWIVSEPTTLGSLSIAEGAEVKASDGYILTLTVDGVEKDLKPGKYSGKVVITPAQENLVQFGMGGGMGSTTTHHFRQAVYLDSSGVERSKSVLAAAGEYAVKGNEIDNLNIRSEGENFNGVYAADGAYTLKGAKLNFVGPGGNDFAGWGAGIMSTGKNTTLVVDNANVVTRGVVRTTLVADKGSNLIVKNSHIEAHEGVQPADYQSNSMPGKMRDVPWMLGLAGNCRATNLLGDNTIATYINSYLAAEGWGVLSIDSSTNTKLTVINSKVEVTGQSGYGTYAIGNSLNSFYGSDVTVPDYGAIVTGGNVVFGASTAELVAKLNADLKLGLTPAELAAIKPTQTMVNSKRFGVMVWGQGAGVNTVRIMDGTVFNTDEAIIVDRGAPATIDVDGSKGAQLNTKNGILLQLMDLDKAPGVMTNGINLTTGVYKEPTLPIAKVAGFDLTATHDNDVIATFSKISLKGDFYNGISSSSAGGGMPGGGMPGGGGGAPGAGGSPGGGPPGGGMPGGQSSPATGKNMILKFQNSMIAGVMSASTARHAKDTLTSADYKLVSEVTNTPGAAINNGVVVALDHSTWTVTGASYLTSLTIGDGSRVIAPQGKTATLTVDGVTKPIGTGDYKGAIVVNVQ